MELLVLLPKTLEKREIDKVLLSSACSFAGDDIPEVSNAEPLDIQRTALGVLKTGDAIRGEHQVQVKRACLDLYEIISAYNGAFQILLDLKPSPLQSADNAPPILRGTSWKNNHVLRYGGKPKKNRAPFPYEEVIDSGLAKSTCDDAGLLRLELRPVHRLAGLKPR